jgi:hypothetical protein
MLPGIMVELNLNAELVHESFFGVEPDAGKTGEMVIASGKIIDHPTNRLARAGSAAQLAPRERAYFSKNDGHFCGMALDFRIRLMICMVKPSGMEVALG